MERVGRMHSDEGMPGLPGMAKSQSTLHVMGNHIVTTREPTRELNLKRHQRNIGEVLCLPRARMKCLLCAH